jgi:hypothetical protein
LEKVQKINSMAMLLGLLSQCPVKRTKDVDFEYNAVGSPTGLSQALSLTGDRLPSHAMALLPSNLFHLLNCPL